MFDKSEPFKKLIQGESFYLPAGIDTIFFCPYPDPPERFIDVLSIGRRSDTTHQALLRMAQENKSFARMLKASTCLDCFIAVWDIPVLWYSALYSRAGQKNA